MREPGRVFEWKTSEEHLTSIELLAIELLADVDKVIAKEIDRKQSEGLERYQGAVV